MFDRNTLIGLLLMVLLLIGYFWWTAPSPEQVAAQRKADSLALAQKEIALQPDTLPAALPPETPGDTALTDSARAQLAAMAASQYGLLSKATEGSAQTVVLKNDVITAELKTQGGLFAQVTLTDGHKRYNDSTAIKLWDAALSQMSLAFSLAGKGDVQSDKFFFTPSATVVDASANPASLTMKLETGDAARYLELVYELKPGEYVVNCRINAVGLDEYLQLTSHPMALLWQAVGITNEKGIKNELQHSSVFYREMDEGRDYLRENSSQEYTTTKKLNWFAFKQYFFSAGAISDEGFLTGSYLHSEPAGDSLHTMKYKARALLPMSAGSQSSTQVKFYFGPNDLAHLRQTDAEHIGRIIDYGPSIIGWANMWIVRPLFKFFQSFIGSYGLILLCITLVIKLLLFPVTWKNFQSSAKQRALKPEIDELNKKYEKRDAVEKQQALMALYRQTGVNPLAGCIPALIQMPILYAMFRFFPASIEFRGKSFLWAEDLAAYDSIFSWSQHIPVLSSFYGNHVSGFTILMCLSTFFYTRWNMLGTPQPTQPGMPNMKVIMNLFTFMMLFFFNSMPSGLTLYYFTANVTSIGQMWFIKNYIIDEKKIRQRIDDNKKKPVKKGGFAQRLEEMQKAQRDRLEEQKSKLKKK